MKKIYNKDQNTMLLKHNNITTLQHNNTKHLTHISGVDNTTSQMTSSKSELASTRGAKVSSEFIEEKYRESAAKIREQDLFYIEVSIKGKKSNGTRREVNIDIIPNSADKVFYFKSHTVCKKLKWELFRDLPEAEKTATCWQGVDYAFDQATNNAIHAGKMITRRKHRTIPRFRVGECAVITEEHSTHIKVYLLFGDKQYEIICEPVELEFFNWKGNHKIEEVLEVL